MRYVATLFKPVAALPHFSRSAYSPEYADRFALNVRRHAPAGSEVVILTDYDPAEFKAGQTILPFVLPERGWACLLEMFRPEVVGPDGAILCGLDTIFIDHTDRLEKATREHRFVVPSDPYHPKQLTNALVGIKPECAERVWRDWLADREAGALAQHQMFETFSEMLWLEAWARKNSGILITPVRFEDIYDVAHAIVSFKHVVRPHGITGDTIAIYFHGEPKPHDLVAAGVPWAVEHWGPPLSTTAPRTPGASIPGIVSLVQKGGWKVTTNSHLTRTALIDGGLSEFDVLDRQPGDVFVVLESTSPIDDVCSRARDCATHFIIEFAEIDPMIDYVAAFRDAGAARVEFSGRVLSGWWKIDALVTFDLHAEPTIHVSGSTRRLILPPTYDPLLAAAAVDAWLERLPPIDTVRFEGEAAEDTYAAARNAALVHCTLRHGVEDVELDEQIASNVAANLTRLTSKPRHYQSSDQDSMMLRAVYGKTLHIIGAGPSLTPGDLRALMDTTDFCWLVDRAVPLLGKYEWFAWRLAVTMEPRAEKLDALQLWGGVVLAHMQSHPQRIDSNAVIYARSGDQHEQQARVPEWVPCVQKCPTVLVFAVRMALRCRPKEIVLHGADSALGHDGRLYADPAIDAHPMHAGNVLVPAIGGGEVQSTPPLRMQIAALQLAAMEGQKLGIRMVNATTRGAVLPGWERSES